MVGEIYLLIIYIYYNLARYNRMLGVWCMFQGFVGIFFQKNLSLEGVSYAQRFHADWNIYLHVPQI